MIDVEGTVADGFEGVRDAFARNFDDHDEVGAAFALHVEGDKVVDIWAGLADPASGRPYAEDTLQLVFSTTKGATAICANQLADRGELDVDAPVSAYWPEFAAAGKDQIPVRWLLCHKAGLPYVDAELDLADVCAWDPVIRALEAQTPYWEPGTAHGYHATTYGWLVGEVVRRVSGKSLDAFFADEVADPLGLEFWIGLPAEQEPRVAPLIELERPTDPDIMALYEMFLGPESVTGRALGAPSGVFLEEGAWNRPEVRAACIPAANGVTNARSLSRMYAACIGEIDGVRLLSPEQVERASEVQTQGGDRVLYVETKFGLGFMLSSAFSPFGGPACLGHPGVGGSVGFADPDHGVGFGYVMNKMQQNLAGDPRTLGLVRATYGALGVPLTFG